MTPLRPLLLLLVIGGCSQDEEKAAVSDSDEVPVEDQQTDDEQDDVATEDETWTETETSSDTDTETGTETETATETETSTDTDTGDEEEICPPVYDPYPFATSIVTYVPGDGAGFGQESLPDIVLGPPLGAGENAGSLDVLTLGHEGLIVLAFDIPIVDGVGPDIIVYENPFIGFPETGIVSASEDGQTWYTWDCDSANEDDLFPGCAGVTPSLSHPDNCIDATDPAVAGGDHFDLADIGLETANYIRVQDSGANEFGGFDLDAVAIVHGATD